MAIYSKSEFCRAIGFDLKHLSTYVYRGKIFVSEDGTINDKLPINKEFVDKWKSKKDIPVDVPVKTKEKKPKVRAEPADEGAGYGELMESRALDMEVKRIKLQREKVDLQLKEIEREKKLGELIPLALVEPIMGALVHSITTEFKNYIDDRDRLNVKKYNIPADEAAMNKGFLIKGLNKAVDKAVNISMEKVKTLANEYSETRRVGEHG